MTISGANFSTTSGNNIVFFGAVRATVLSASSGTLTVTVPDGATYQPMTVTVGGLTAYAQQPFLVTFPGSGNISTNSLAPSIDSSTDLHPNDITMADFDGDGKPDLATANNYSTTGSPASVSILRNTSSNGAISFGVHQDIPTGVQTFAIAAGDLDGDGKPDMVSSSLADKTISVFRNTSSPGNISFAAKTDYATGQNPYGIAIGDLDGDGKPDIAVTNYVSNTISLYRNTSTVGTISFAAGTDISTGADLGPWGIAIQDLDGDGKPDLAVTNNLSNTISVFRNTSTLANISFAPSIHFYGSSAPQGIAIGDMDGDGKPDLVWAINGQNTAFAVERNLSSPGTLNFVASTPHTYNITYAYDIAISDINGDGKPDVLIPSYGKTSVFQNASTTGSISLTEMADLPGNSPYAAVVGDVNGDGYPDLVTTNFTSTYLSVYKNQVLVPSVTSFSPATASQGATVTITGNNFSGTTAVSFGGVPASSFTVVNNTTLTAIVGSGEGGDVSVTNAYGTGSLSGFSFTGPPRIKSFTPASADSGVVVTLTGINFIDVTGVSFNGTPALSFQVISPTEIQAIVGNGVSGDITVTNNYGAGSIPGFVVAQPVIGSFAPTTAGRRDTVTITGSNFSAVTAVSFGGMPAISFSILSPTEIRAVVRGGNSGDIKIATVRSVSLPGFTFQLPAAPVISSVAPDSGRAGSSVTITGDHFSPTLTNNIVYFGATRATVLSSSPTTLVAAVPVAATYETISVVNTETQLTGKSIPFFTPTQPVVAAIDSTTFAPPVRFTNPNQYDPWQMLLCDFNNDGKIDIAGESGSTFITVRKNTSTKKRISFEDGIIVPIGGSGSINHTFNIQIADIDGDGKKDLIAIKQFANDTNYISVFRNISTPDSILFAPAVEFQSVVNTESIFVFDIDGDGRMDIFAQGQGENIILRNTSSGAGDISFETSPTTLPGWNGIAVCEDFDGDGKPDIVAGSGLAVWYIQNTSSPGSISFASPYGIYYAAIQDHYLWTISAGDIDGDGKNDLLILNSGNSSGNFAVLRNTSTGPAVTFASIDFPTSGFPDFCTLGDVDGDGKPDLVTSELDDQLISVYRNTSHLGIPSFAPKQDYKNLSLHSGLAVGDFDGDGKPDISLSMAPISSCMDVLRNQSADLIIRFNGATHFCEGGQITLHSSLSFGNQWYRDGRIISGATADSLVVTISGTYSDTVTMLGAPIPPDSTITIRVIPIPAKPVISRGANNELLSSSSSGNQWFGDSGRITGAIDSAYLPAAPAGNYRVQVTIDGCVSPISDAYHYVALDNGDPVRIYPNPTKGQIWIVFSLPNVNTVNTVTLSLYNKSGEKLFEKKNVHSGDSISLSAYPAGSYFLQLTDESTNAVVGRRQVIKL